MTIRQLAIVVLSLAFGNAAGATGNAVGIVMKISGPAAASWPMMTELPANTAIPVGQGGELTFLHYGKCKLVTVAGGTLTLTDVGYQTDGRIESEKNGPCPQVHALAGGSTAGAIVTRGIRLATRLPVDSDIIFAGSHAAQIVAAAIYTDGQPDQPLVQLNYSGGRATMPAGAAPLVANARYVLRLEFRDRPPSINFPFVAAASGEGGSLVILRVD